MDGILRSREEWSYSYEIKIMELLLNIDEERGAL
jgi:hypothetical protein